MFKKIKKNVIFFQFFIIIFSFSPFLNESFAFSSQVVAVWKTIDDVSGKPKSLISIQKRGKQYVGRIQKIFYQPNEKQHRICEKCTGEKHNRPLIGLPILTIPDTKDGLVNGCEILDPKNGKTYQCQITLIEKGNTLKVRGYIGLPLIGRTQLWHKVTVPSHSKISL